MSRFVILRCVNPFSLFRTRQYKLRSFFLSFSLLPLFWSKLHHKPVTPFFRQMYTLGSSIHILQTLSALTKNHSFPFCLNKKSQKGADEWEIQNLPSVSSKNWTFYSDSYVYFINILTFIEYWLFFSPFSINCHLVLETTMWTKKIWRRTWSFHTVNYGTNILPTLNGSKSIPRIELLKWGKFPNIM